MHKHLRYLGSVSLIGLSTIAAGCGSDDSSSSIGRSVAPAADGIPYKREG